MEYSFEQLIDMLNNEQKQSRLDSIYYLGGSHDRSGGSSESRALDVLVALLDDQDRDIQIAAITALGFLGASLKHQYSMIKPTATLLPYLNHINPDLRCRAVTALGRLGDATVIESLIGALADDNATIRGCVADALCWLKATQAIPHLLNGLRDRQAAVRSRCIEVLVILAPAATIVEEMIGLLHDSNAYVRLDAAKALGNMHDRQAFAPLIDYLRREIEINPNEGAIALAMLGSEVFETLIAYLDDMDPNVRYWVVVALGYLGDIRAIPHLQHLMEHDSSKTRSRAKISTAAKKSLNKLNQVQEIQ